MAAMPMTVIEPQIMRIYSRERVERGGEEIEDSAGDARIEEGELKRGGRAGNPSMMRRSSRRPETQQPTGRAPAQAR